MDSIKQLKILILEDRKEDVILIKRELKNSGLNFILVDVDEKTEYVNSLENFQPDIILSDHSLPRFNSMEALQICRENQIDIPFILVTGTVSEEFAAQCIKNGADDYVLKSNIKRLSTSIEQALRHREDERMRKEAERMLIDQNNELLKINSELDSFVYNISHNLRAPLLSLLGLLNLAKKDTVELNNETLNEYLDRIDFSATRLDKTLCDILDYSKNARSEPINEEIDLKDLFEEAFSKIQYMENSSSTRYQVQIDQETEFVSDKYRLNIIINNLITNAVKYQDKSKKNHEISVNGKVKAKNAEIHIADSGIGIEKKYLENIFRMFYRASTLSEGSGLGLYIVKETLDKLSGAISVDSELGQGTTFHLIIPNMINNKKIKKRKTN